MGAERLYDGKCGMKNKPIVESENRTARVATSSNVTSDGAAPGIATAKAVFVNPIPFRERICCSIPEACLVSGFGRTTIYSLISSRRVKTVKIGRRTLINIQSLLALLEPE